jgi:carbonic anhydrase
MRLLEAIVAANNAAAGRPGKLDLRACAQSLPIAALTCIDPRLNHLFPEALGLGDEEFIWLRNAGNVITSSLSSTVRSVAMSVYLKSAHEIAVIGHSDCQMALCGINDLLDRMKAQGVSRSSLSIPDLHEFFGLFISEKPNVRKAVGFLRASPVIPQAIPIHGLLIDTHTGRLEWVINGYEAGATSLETHGAPEELPHTAAYAVGPVKSLGSHVVSPAALQRPIPPPSPAPPPQPPPPSRTPTHPAHPHLPKKPESRAK